LWKNGELQTLSDTGKFSDAYSVYVLNGDVYMVGSIRVSNSDVVDKAALWKNGKLQTLKVNADGESVAYSVFVVKK